MLLLRQASVCEELHQVAEVVTAARNTPEDISKLNLNVLLNFFFFFLGGGARPDPGSPTCVEAHGVCFS